MLCVSKHVRLSEPTTKIWMKIDYTISDDDIAQWLYRFWQYKVHADIRNGSQDLCKFFLRFYAYVSRHYITYSGTGTPLSFSISSVCLWQLAIPIRLPRNLKCLTSGDVWRGVAEYDPQSIWNPQKKLRIFRRRYVVGILNKANISIYITYSPLSPFHWLQNTWTRMAILR